MISTEQLMDILDEDYKQNKDFVLKTYKKAKKQQKQGK